MSEPNKVPFFAVKRILRYVKGTKTFDILYKSKHNSNLISHTNSDWVTSVDDCKSTSGYVFLLVFKVMSWALKKQKIIALSLAEVEYKARTSVVAEVIWLRRILYDLQ